MCRIILDILPVVAEILICGKMKGGADTMSCLIQIVDYITSHQLVPRGPGMQLTYRAVAVPSLV